MTPDGPNPEHMQKKPRAKRNSTVLPLILIHDGGGTTAGFWALGKLGRDVWVIHNPKFWSGESWEGMDAMAHHYLRLIEERGIKGRVVLGGWSLGGFVSIAMARILATREPTSTSIEVAGLLLVDAPYYEPWANGSPAFGEPVLPDMPPKVKHTLAKCDELLCVWPLPAWGQHALEGSDVRLNVEGRSFTVPSKSVLHKSLDEDWSIKEVFNQDTLQRNLQNRSPDSEGKPPSPPLAVLVRCVKSTPALNGDTAPCHVDLFREYPVLGWEANYESFIRVIMDIDSSHYAVFDRYNRPLVKCFSPWPLWQLTDHFYKITQLTSLLNTSMEILDRREVSDAI